MFKLTSSGTVTVLVSRNTNSIRLHFYIYPDHIEFRDQHGTMGSAKIERMTYESLLRTSVRKGTGVIRPTDLKSVRLTN